MQAKIYVSNQNANYYKPRVIAVTDKYGDTGVLYAEGQQFGSRCFFDNSRLFVMENSELESNFEPLAGKED